MIHVEEHAAHCQMARGIIIIVLLLCTWYTSLYIFEVYKQLADMTIDENLNRTTASRVLLLFLVKKLYFTNSLVTAVVAAVVPRSGGWWLVAFFFSGDPATSNKPSLSQSIICYTWCSTYLVQLCAEMEGFFSCSNTKTWNI